MDVQKALEEAGGAIGAKRVFAKPYERDGVVVIPAAKIMGGGGGGEGEGPQPGTDGEHAATSSPHGAGLGFGLMAQPAGAYVIKNGRVKWKPAVDVNGLLLRMQVLALVALLLFARERHARGRRRR